MRTIIACWNLRRVREMASHHTRRVCVPSPRNVLAYRTCRINRINRIDRNNRINRTLTHAGRHHTREERGRWNELVQDRQFCFFFSRSFPSVWERMRVTEGALWSAWTITVRLCPHHDALGMGDPYGTE